MQLFLHPVWRIKSIDALKGRRLTFFQHFPAILVGMMNSMIIFVKSQFHKVAEAMTAHLKILSDNSEIATDALIEKMMSIFPQISAEPIKALQPVKIRK